MKKNQKEEPIYIEHQELKEEYELVKLSDMFEENVKLQSIDLPKEYEEKMPLLRDLYPPKKRTLKRR